MMWYDGGGGVWRGVAGCVLREFVHTVQKPFTVHVMMGACVYVLRKSFTAHVKVVESE